MFPEVRGKNFPVDMTHASGSAFRGVRGVGGGSPECTASGVSESRGSRGLPIVKGWSPLEWREEGGRRGAAVGLRGG